MPLNDSFRKGGASNVVKLAAVPTSDDLIFSLSNAQKTPRKPVFIAWQVNEEKRLLSVTCGMNPSRSDARWTLRSGQDLSAPVMWSHDTGDALMIHTLVSDTVSNIGGPAAAIPDFLRPDYKEPGSEKVEAADKDYSLEAPGSIFADRYEIIEEIGKGATSTVYKAKQVQIGRIVALKLMHSHLLKEENNKRRFEQEAKATAALSHTNLVLVHDYGTSPLGRPFIVMDFVDGPSLDTIVSNQGRLTSRQFVEVFNQCCRGLAHAHKKGVIHRDIKPSNIRLFKDDNDQIVAKILDFGIAKLFTADEDALKMTEVGSVMGSPAFMSPEQSRAENVDHRTDIYSLGVVMFHSATGVLPFKGKDIFETLYKHIYDPIPTFASLNLDYRIPEAVERMIHKSLEKDPNRRHQTMEELLGELAQLASHKASSEPMKNSFQSSFIKHETDNANKQSALEITDQHTAVVEAPVPPAISVTELDLLKSACIITEQDVAKVTAMASQFGGQPTAMLIAEGKIDKPLLDVAKRSVTCINGKTLDLGRAIILLNYSQRSRLNFDQAVAELGWNLEQ